MIDSHKPEPQPTRVVIAISAYEARVISLQTLLERARLARVKLPPLEASALFAAAMRLAVEQGIAPRPCQLLLDDKGTLSLARDETGPAAPGYLAPELSADDPPRRTEPRVQVYAAGALGYELLTAEDAPVPPAVPGPDLGGPLADLVRLALAVDRRERFGDLRQLLDAVEVVQPRRSQETERQLLTSLSRRARVWGGEPAPATEADGLRLLSARVAVLEDALKQLRGQHDGVLKKLAAAAEQVRERHANDPRRGAGAGQHEDGPQVLGRSPMAEPLEPQSDWEAEALREAGGTSLGKVFAVATAAALLVLGLASGAAYLLRDSIFQPPPEHAASVAVAPEPASAAAVHEAPASAVLAPPLAPESVDAGLAVQAPVDAGQAEEAPQPAAAAAEPPPGELNADAGAAEAAPGPSQKVSPNMIALSVARSQVNRGEKALEAGNAGQAIADFRAALDNQPDLPEALRGLGMAHVLQGKDAEAKADYESYLTADPQAADAADIRMAIRELKSRSKLGGNDK